MSNKECLTSTSEVLYHFTLSHRVMWAWMIKEWTCFDNTMNFFSLSQHLHETRVWHHRIHVVTHPLTIEFFWWIISACSNASFVCEGHNATEGNLWNIQGWKFVHFPDSLDTRSINCSCVVIFIRVVSYVVYISTHVYGFLK